MQEIFAQRLSYPVVYQKAPSGIFSFTGKWNYPEGVVKHDDGTFEQTDGEKIKPADTAHQYFTANCKTNVQGGYTVNYCQAKRKGNTINLDFSGGLPAYANDFNATIKGDTFRFDPHVVYPALNLDEKLTYKVTRGKLIIYQQNHGVRRAISGYIKTEFVETIRQHNKSAQVTRYYFEGYFKTAVN